MDAIKYLMSSLYQALGNKRYLHDMEKIFEKLGELSPYEMQTLHYLAQDIRDLRYESDRNKQEKYMGIR